MPIAFLNRALGGASRAFDTDVLSWRDAVVANGGSVSLARLIVVDQFVFSEKAAGTWALTDDYWGFWAENAAQALTSLKQRRLATAVNTPTFTADRDYTFDGSTNYIDTGFVPSTHAVAMTGTSQRIGVYERTNVNAARNAIGCSATASRRMTLTPRSGTAAFANLNTAGGTNGLALWTVDSRGFKAVSRAGGSLTVKGYDRGVVLPDAVAGSVGTTLPEYSVFIGGVNDTGLLSSARASAVGFAVVGAPLSDAQELAQYNAMQAWATSVGAQV